MSQYKFIFIGFVFILLAGCSNAAGLGGHVDAGLRNFEVGTPDLESLISASEAPLLIDIREPSELRETGIIAGSVNLPIGSISADSIAALGIDKDTPVALICRSGSRSAQAHQLFTALGYTDAVSLQGGILHWQEDGGALEAWGENDPLPIADFASLTPAADAPQLTLDRIEHDFGEIPQFGGVVSTDFQITNTGKSNLEIGTLTTSCSCTTAKIDESTILPNESALLTVIFNPDFHEEPLDRFRRSVFIPTNDPVNTEAIVTVWVDILENQ